MTLDNQWLKALRHDYDKVKEKHPSADALIRYTAAPGFELDPERERVVVGLIESAWSNPLFYPDGGFPAATAGETHPLLLPGSQEDSLLTAFSRARGLLADTRLFGYVLAANGNGEIIAGSRNHWRPFSELTMEEARKAGSVEYYDESGKRLKYSQALLPEKLEAKGGTDEFTLDVLAVKTFNQYADAAIFIVPEETFFPVDGVPVDMPDYRLAPLPIDAKGRPLVISSSHGGKASMALRKEGTSKEAARELWPVELKLPQGLAAQDYTGVVMTLSAGDQVAGIDLRDGTGADDALSFNSWPSSSPLFLTVGGVKYDTKDGDKDTITGAVAWRHPPSSAMEGGNGGFTAAAPLPAYQQVSPWIQRFLQQAQAEALKAAWTVPVRDARDPFPWWSAGGDALSLPHRSAAYRYRFLATSSADSKALAVNPAASRQMPDLSNLAWPDDFLSITLKEPVDLTDASWPEKFQWNGDGGTSLAAPATAALLASVNLRRRRLGLADLSATEIHYLLYQLPPDLLTDITKLQAEPLERTTAYPARRGYDYASGLGAIGGPGGGRLVEQLSRQSLPLLPPSPTTLPEVIVKPGRVPLVLARQAGATGSLRLVRMNGYALQALMEAAAVDPDVLTRRLLPTLEAAAKINPGTATAATYQVSLLEPSWTPAAAGTVIDLPLDRFLASEGVAVAAGSIVQLADLPDIAAEPSGSPSGTPAFYAFLTGAGEGEGESTLTFQPFQANQGALLRQGATLQPSDGSGSATLLSTALQWPLLQQHVALATGATAAQLPALRVELTLRSVAGFANLYGLYAVDAPDGTIADPVLGPVAPGAAAYAGLALKRALAGGRDSFLWAAPHRATIQTDRLQDWSNPADPSPGRSLADALEPGRTYQHFILSSPSPQARQELVASLLSGAEPGPELLNRLHFAVPSANGSGQGHALGIANRSSLLTLGFEDQPNLGDRDFNDVIASWSLQEGVSIGIGSTVLLDLIADRVPDLAIGSQAGAPSTAVILATDSGATLRTWQPFGADDRSGVQVGAGDVNGDGFDDLAAVRQTLSFGATAELGREVRVLLGQAASSKERPLNLGFTAFDGTIAGPLSMAVRDLDLDGMAEVVVTATQADPLRRSLALEVWSLSGGAFQLRTDLNLPDTSALDPSRGYAVALGDLQGDGPVELVLGDLQGANLFVGSVDPKGRTTAPGIVLQPYGAGSRQGVRPTVVSAQQTLIQRPQGLAADALPWSVGTTSGSNDALLAGLGTPGALIVQSADPLTPRPLALPLTWLATGPTAEPALEIPWTAGDGAPVFSSGGVSYTPVPPATAKKPVELSGSPHPILVSATAGSSALKLLAGPKQESGTWQTIANSENSLFSQSDATPGVWANPWAAGKGIAINPVDNRDLFNQVSTAITSYTPPFAVNLNPLNLSRPQDLIADLSGPNGSLSIYTDTVVKNWDPQKTPTPWGPQAPGQAGKGTGVRPQFNVEIAPNQLVQLYQQRLVNVAMASLGVNYQHHHTPLWYSPQSWSTPTTPPPQVRYLTSPELRQTQGVDCSNFSSWNYNLAFGFWLNSEVGTQATLKDVEVDWLTGTSRTLKAQKVLGAEQIYRGPDGATRTNDQVIDFLNSTLQPGDLLYLSPTPVDKDPQKVDASKASHVITWLNDNSGSNPRTFVSLPAGAASATAPPTGSGAARPAFIIDSTGSESVNDLDQAYPNGVQIREFDSKAWYVNSIIGISRWLTPDNVTVLHDAMTATGATLG